MDSESLIVKKNIPSHELAIYAINNIYHPKIDLDWIHVKFMPFLESNGNLKFLLKVSNPSFDPLPPVKIILTLQPFIINVRENGKISITSTILEHLIVDSLPEGGRAEYEVFSKNHSALLKIPFSLSVKCFPCFDSNDNNDWNSPPLYKTILTSLDLLLNANEISALNLDSKIIPLKFDAQRSFTRITITGREAIKIVHKEMKDITDEDIMGALFHYKLLKREKLYTGYVLMENSLIEVRVEVIRIVPRRTSDAFHIKTTTNIEADMQNKMLFYQIRRKLGILCENGAFPIQRSSHPSTVIWKKKCETSESQNYDFTYEAE
uniref:Uncharacterized protein n=1 Tax=Panagrolaimus sp. ES5 TaxID=591445 RepID=A0AC34F1H9_9BILA